MPIAALALTHGAGSNRESHLLVSLEAEFEMAGVAVERYDLPFRRARASGPPRAGDPERDRAGILEILEGLRSRHPGLPVFAGGHSYGGRQTTMLAAENADCAAGLLLLSYPLHPPRRREQLRVEHFPKLRTPSLFVHGTRDPFGLPEEMTPALDLIPARHELHLVERAGHELTNAGAGLAPDVVAAFLRFFGLRQA